MDYESLVAAGSSLGTAGVTLIHPSFISTLTQKPLTVPFLPIADEAKAPG